MRSKRRDAPERSLDPSRPEALFDPAWYLRTYPDVAAAGASAWSHFVRAGEAEGRSPGPDFDTEFYRRTHLALEGERPFTHYVLEGRARGHVPARADVTPEQTMNGILAALQGRPHPILLLGNDARAAGGPLLLLEIARRLRSRGHAPVFLLNQGGPLFPSFASLGPTLIAEEGWDLPALGAALPADLPILANTGWGALLADRLGVVSRAVALVHEMPEYLRAQDLLAPVSRAGVVVASMPALSEQLEGLWNDTRAVTTIVPGLRAPESSSRGARRVRRLLTERFGPISHVYIGAGYADRRKGFDLFLDAARLLADRDSSAVFVWLGDQGAWARERADQATDAGLRLELPGFRDDADDWYSASDVYLLTSRQDPGPTTVMSAAGVGVPFVGLSADIGLRSLTDVVARTGEFVDDVEALAQRAGEVALADTHAERRARARFVRTYRSLDRYVDDIASEVAKEAPGWRRPRGAGLVRARARLLVVDAARDLRYAFALPVLVERVRGLLWRARVRAPRIVRRKQTRRRLLSAAVQQSPVSADASRSDPRAVVGADAAYELVSGDRVWLDAPETIALLPERADLHLLRDTRIEPWPLVGRLEGAVHRIDRLTQHDIAAPPRWARTGAPPPPPRMSRARRGWPRTGVALAPRSGDVRPLSIGVFLHVYYLDVAEQLADRLAVIDQPFALYVSTTDEGRREAIQRLLPQATVRVFPNRGRDVAPKVFGFAAEHAAHDVVLHLHTKRSPHRRLDDWLPHLLDSLLPSTDGVRAILAAFSEVPELGMISPAPPASLGDIGWGPNRALAEVVTWGRGWPPLPDDRRLRFAAGSMFWARPEALRPLQDLAIPADAFSESSATDGTLAHTVERLIGVSCDVAGLGHLLVEPSRSVAERGGRSSREIGVTQIRRTLRGQRRRS